MKEIRKMSKREKEALLVDIQRQRRVLVVQLENLRRDRREIDQQISHKEQWIKDIDQAVLDLEM